MKIPAPPEGRVRVFGVDRALNKSNPVEIQVSCEPLKITHMGIVQPLDQKHVWDPAAKPVLASESIWNAYGIEVVANKDCKLLLVNVDAEGQGQRLLPTPCETGRDFPHDLRAAQILRYPYDDDQGRYFLGLNEYAGIEDIYAIAYLDDVVKEKVWEWVKWEFCDEESSPGRDGTSKTGTRELPGIKHEDGKKADGEFVRKLEQLVDDFGGRVAYEKRYFHHSKGPRP